MYQPLTKEQYQKAVKSGFTLQQIISNEKIRKEKSSNILPAKQQEVVNKNGMSWDNEQGVVQKEPVKEPSLGDYAKQILPSIPQAVNEFSAGVSKGVGRTVVDVAQLAKGAFDVANKINPVTKLMEKIPVIKKANEAISNTGDKALNYAKEKLQPSNIGEEIGGYAETAAEFLAPAKLAKMAVETPNEIKALKLSVDELKKINPKKLSWLSKDVLSEGKTVGGILKSKAYAIPEKTKQLATEFKDILKGSPEKIRANAENLGKDLYKKTLNLFEGSEKAVNKNQFLNTMKNVVKKDLDTVYDSEYQAKQAAEKAVEKLKKYITKGTNKGIEEARMKWYSEAKNASGKLTNANKVIHDSIKSFVRETLPEEKKIAYDAYKKTMAKTYDIEEIMKARIKTAVEKGESTVKKVKKVLPYIGGAAIAEGFKKLFTGKY